MQNQATIPLKIEASVIGSVVPPVSTTIPSTSKGSEIKNFLHYSHQMEIPEGSCLVLKIPIDVKKTRFNYRILEDDKDLSRIAPKLKNITTMILIHPKTILLKIHCADGRVSIREYPCKTPSVDIIQAVCKDFFHLKHEIAYALYPNINNLNEPIQQTKSIIEYDPTLQDVWLLRRFWIQAKNTLNEESDIHFNYSHARNIVFAMEFPFKFYEWEKLVAISLTIEYGTYEQTKVLLKKEKKEKKAQAKEEKKKEKKEKKDKKKKSESSTADDDSKPTQMEISHFPKWMLADKKIKKRKHEIIEIVKDYQGREVIDLKRMFLEICLENKFFGALMFPVKCQIPNTSQPEEDYTLSFSEEFIHLLVKDTETDVYKIPLQMVKKWKPSNATNIEFNFFPSSNDKKVIRWEVCTSNSYSVIDYFTSLVNFIKQQAILAQKDPSRNISGDRSFLKTENTGLNDILARSDLNTNLASMESKLDDLETLRNADSLNRIEPPSQQQIVSSDPSEYTVYGESENMYNEFSGFYPREEGYRYEPTPLLTINESIIESGCSLLRTIITNESISPVADATAWVQSCLPEDLLTQSVLGWQLQGSTETNEDTISTVSRCIAYVFQSELSPLDSFVTLNYVRSLLLHNARGKWKGIDFAEMAEQVDEALGDVLRPVFSITRRLVYPLSTLVFEDSSDILPLARSMLYLNETIAMLLFFSAISISRALCNAGIGCESLQPILNTLPVVHTYDPVVAYALSEALLPILNTLQGNEDAQNALLSQPHVAKIDIQNIPNCILELYNYTHFMSSSVAVFCRVRSPRLLNIPATPSTIPEAGYVFQIAREAALTLWNIGYGKHGALAQELSWISSEFYTIFIEAARDPSLSNYLGAVFKDLIDCLVHAAQIFQANSNMPDILSFTSPVDNILINLFNSSEDTRTTQSLIALDSVNPKHRSMVLQDSGQRIDTGLRGIKDNSFTEDEVQSISDSFRVFSLMAVSLTRDPQKANLLRADLAELGKLLTVVMRDNMDPTQRAQQTNEIITRINAIISDSQDMSQFVEFSTININSESLVKASPISDSQTSAALLSRAITAAQTPVQIRIPDVSVSTDILKRLASVLKRFTLNTLVE